MGESIGKLRDYRKMKERLDEAVDKENDTANPEMVKRAIGRERDENEPAEFPTFEGEIKKHKKTGRMA